MANSVDPDQTSHSVASDLGLHCLFRLSAPILRVIMVYCKAFIESFTRFFILLMSFFSSDITDGKWHYRACSIIEINVMSLHKNYDTMFFGLY